MSRNYRDEADPQAGNDPNNGAKLAKVEWSRLKVLVIDEPHQNGDAICNTSPSLTVQQFTAGIRSNTSSTIVTVQIIQEPSSKCTAALL